MSSSDYMTGLYVAVPVYFIAIGLSAVWAYRHMEQMKHNGVADQLSAHYLGGRTFGPLVSAGTVFATLFSGYNIVGIPNEAYNYGYFALRWLVGTSLFVYFIAGTGPRLRKASMIRNHQSPVDFITDRYQSQLLRYAILASQALSSLIYISAQVVTLKKTFNSIFDIDPDSPWSTVVIFVIILIFEWVGGLSSVAFTDCIQGFVMVISFLVISSVVKRNFGGFVDLVPETYPKPQVYQTLSKELQWRFWQFNLNGLSLFAAPHFVQRVYSARDLKSLKFAWTVMCFAPWLTAFVGVFLGIVGVQMLGGEPVANPFTSILEKIMGLGGFAKGAGVINFTASLAAIMSTADSLVIAISQLFTTEMIYPLKPKATPAEVAFYGRFVSLVAVIFALLIGLTWDAGITDLVGVQFPLGLQAAPAFLFGLFATNNRNDVHPWSLAFGAIAGMIYVLIFYFTYVNDNPDALPMDAGSIGIILNAFFVAGCELVRRYVMHITPSESEQPHEKAGIALTYADRPTWDIPMMTRFGEHALTPKLLNKAMDGFKEPFRNPWCIVAVIFAVTMATPLTAENDPPMQSDGTLLYFPKVVRGIPWWAFRSIMCAAVGYLLTFVMIRSTPDDFPVDETKIAMHGIHPDLMEMTPQELGRRTSYDERNHLASTRRRSIIKAMEDLGIHEEQDEEVPVAKKELVDEGHRRLSALVLGKLEMEEVFDEVDSSTGVEEAISKKDNVDV